MVGREGARWGGDGHDTWMVLSFEVIISGTGQWVCPLQHAQEGGVSGWVESGGVRRGTGVNKD